jgi:hypothetical protein
VIRLLSSFCGGHPHDKGIIAVTGTPYSAQPTYQPENAADLQSDSSFCSQNAPNQWLCYDFKTMRIVMTQYIVRSNSTA